MMTIFHNTSVIQINFPVCCLIQMTYNRVQTDYFYAQRCIRRSAFCIVGDGGGGLDKWEEELQTSAC